MNSTLSTFNTTTEVPLSKAPNPQLLPRRWSNGCPLLQVRVHSVCVHYSLLCVCVHLDGLNAEHQFRTAPGACSQCVCSLLTTVCVHLDGLNAEHQFRVWVTYFLSVIHIFSGFFDEYKV